MEIYFENQTLAFNFMSAIQQSIAHHSHRSNVPNEWNELLALVRNEISEFGSFPASLELDNEHMGWVARAMDEFFSVHTFRYFDTPDEYLAEADDFNRLYDRIAGRYSRRYKQNLNR